MNCSDADAGRKVHINEDRMAARMQDLHLDNNNLEWHPNLEEESWYSHVSEATRPNANLFSGASSEWVLLPESPLFLLGVSVIPVFCDFTALILMKVKRWKKWSSAQKCLIVAQMFHPRLIFRRYKCLRSFKWDWKVRNCFRKLSWMNCKELLLFSLCPFLEFC